MIPRYPIFKPLELNDQTEVAVHTTRCAPYSDFNFVSMWSWNVREEFRLSTLHGNLVVRFTDYVTEQPFYSFLGDQRVTDTAEELLRRSLAEGLPERLGLVPESTAHRMEGSRVRWEPDFDGSDYIFSTRRLRMLDGSDLKGKRYLANRFVRDNPAHRVERIDLRDRAMRAAMLGLFEEWVAQKGYTHALEVAEFRAFQRLLEASHYLPELYGLGVFVHDRFAAFAVLEFVHRAHCMGHYCKADTAAFEGVTPFVMRTIGELLGERQYEYLNWEQDLGLAGLRQNKSSYIPAAYLRKYNIVGAPAVADVAARPSVLSIAVPERFLASVEADSLAQGVSLRAPTLSEDLFMLAAEDESPAHGSVRNSGIRLAGDTDEEIAAPPQRSTSSLR